MKKNAREKVARGSVVFFLQPVLKLIGCLTEKKKKQEKNKQIPKKKKTLKKKRTKKGEKKGTEEKKT